MKINEIKVKIGILGGIGPEASANFYEKLISKLQKCGLIKKNTDYPQIIINSIPAPELTKDKITKEKLNFYLKGIKEIDKMNVDFIVMICNTIHLFLDAFKKRCNAPILDLREKIYKILKQKKVNTIAVLSTKSSNLENLYKFQDFNYISLTQQDYKKISLAINEFNIGKNGEKHRSILKKIIFKCFKKGAEVIILGCTEIALMLEDELFPKIDTIEVLVDLTVSNYKSLIKKYEKTK